MKKLLVVGMNSVHTYNFIELIQDYFDEILLITNTINEAYSGKIKAINFSISNSFGLLKVIPEIKSIVREFQPTLIHIHQTNTAAWFVLTAIREMKQTAIVTAWGSDILVNPQRGFFYRKMVEQILFYGNYFTADASFLADKMKQLSKKNIDVEMINFGIDPIINSLSDLNALLLQKENIIYSNRLHKKLYRIDQIILSFATFIKNKSVPWKLVIAATGTETAGLQQLTNKLCIENYVSFIGWANSDENVSWYRKSKIFVSYPESDATSVSLLEAMSAGCIPILADLPANKEWITDGVNGIISARLSGNDFENAIQLCNGTAAEKNLSTIFQKATKANSRKLFFDLYERAIAQS